MDRSKIDESVKIARGAVVIGDVTIGKDSSIWYNAVIRGDEHPIIIGEGTNIQDNAVLHVGWDASLTIGNYVTVGHGAILHGCTVEDGALIGMGAIVLDGAVIGKNSLVAAGALVTANTIVPEGSLVMGNPAKIRRELTPEEIEKNLRGAKYYIKESKGIEV